MKKAFLVVALLVAVPSTSPAAADLFEADMEDNPSRMSIFLYPFAEDVKWKQYFEGARILDEKGDRYGAGAVATFETGPSIYRLKGEYFQGTGDVVGNSDGFSWATEVKVYGVRLEADGGWRIPIGRASIVPNLGVGYRWWRRDYQSSATVTGVLQKWHTFYFKAGALAEYEVGRGIVPYAEAGLRIGIFNNNEVTIDGNNVSMNPSGRVTPYAEAGLKLSILKGAVYYERIEFGESDPVPVSFLPPGLGLVQTEVKADIVGARVGISF